MRPTHARSVVPALLAILAGLATQRCSSRSVRELPRPTTIESALRLPGRDFDPAFVTLLIEAEVDASVRPHVEIAVVDQLAGEAAHRIAGTSRQEERLRIVSAYLFHERGYQPASDKLDTKNRFSTLHGLLRGHGGNCFSLSALLAGVCKRLDIPVRIVNASSHLFVRLGQDGEQLQIETTTGDVATSDQYVRELGLKGTDSLRALGDRQFVALTLCQSAARIGARGQLREALALANRAIAIDGTSPFPRYNRGLALVLLGEYREGLASIEEAIRLRPEVPIFWIGKAAALHKMNRGEEARAAVREALRIPMRIGYKWAECALALLHFGLHAPALRCIGRAITIEPENKDFLAIRRRITLVAPLE